MSTEIVVQNEVNPLIILSAAIERGMGEAQIAALVSLADKWESMRERRDYLADQRLFREAMATFHANAPTIYKDSHVKFKTEKGVTEYDHASHGNVTETIGKALAAVGISHRWTHKQDGSGVSVTCYLSFGTYSEDTTLTAPPDASGGKNTIQAIISTKSYLERHTLTGITGMATNDLDDDGRGGKQDGMADELLAECLADVARAPNHDTLVQIFKDRYAGAQAAKDTAAQTKISEAKDKRKAELDAEVAEKAHFAEAMAECADLESWNKIIVSLMKDNRRGWEKVMGAKEAKRRGYKPDKTTGKFVEVTA